MTDAFLALDRDSRLTYVNRHAEKLIGRHRDELLGRNLFEAFPELVGTPFERGYQRVVRTQAPVEFEEYYADRKAWLEVRAYPAEDGVTVYYRDITRRKRSELAQQSLVAMVSHDLRNPLFLMKASSELLGERLAAGAADQELIAETLGRIQRASRQMSGVIDELVDLVQLQSGRDLPLDRQPVDLVALARRAAEQHQFSTAEHRIVVTAEVEALVGAWDGRRLDRVLANLLTNAIKYSPPDGEITIGISRQTSKRGEAQALLSVQDRGRGIPSEDLPHIFERFYRGCNVDGVPGSGIGLAGVRHIVERHGGLISVSSQPGAGTTFTVRLPLTCTSPLEAHAQQHV
ncbi:MAG: PAS domain-containing protein [Chloroflexi bacterium]|nr:PAS domain-containing protein [Chloroflexota bacterium]